jgi:hypothetical protein
MRVHRFLPIPPPAEDALESLRQVDGILNRFRNPKWNAGQVQLAPNKDIEALARGFALGRQSQAAFVECGILAVSMVAEVHGSIKKEETRSSEASSGLLQQDDSGRIIPPMFESEEMAAESLAKVGGPLSWMEVIGAADSSPIRREPPVTEQQSATWENIFGTPPVSAGEEAAAAEVKHPFSWGDVIGATPPNAGRPVSAPPVAPVVEKPIVEKPIVEKLIVEKPVAPPAAPWENLPEEGSEKPAPFLANFLPSADKPLKNALNWADVIGVADKFMSKEEDEKKE